MAEITPFAFPETGQRVRTILMDGEPWFIAADVCAALDIANVGNALGRLDDDEKSSIRLTDGTPGNPNRGIVNESGLYELIVRSDRPDAKRFRRWITHEVLPAIRKTGSYSTVRALPQTFAEALRSYAAEVEAHEVTKQRAAELEAPAQSWETLAEAVGDYSVRETAQILNRDPAISTGQNRLFKTMYDIGWIDGSGQPYQAQVDNGRLVRRTTSYTHPHTGESKLSSQIRVTPKGLDALRHQLGGAQITLVGGAS